MPTKLARRRIAPTLRHPNSNRYPPITPAQAASIAAEARIQGWTASEMRGWEQQTPGLGTPVADAMAKRAPR